MASYQYFQWYWSDFCPTGIQPFAADSNDLLPCFQEICLQIPVYTIFAAVSSYNFGCYNRPVIRNPTQKRLIYLRIITTLFLAALPVTKIFFFHSVGLDIHAVDVLVVSIEFVMWILHCGYLLSSRKFGELSHRGSLSLMVLWSSVFVLDVVWLRSSLSKSFWPWSLATVLMDIMYGLTLIPKGSAVPSSQNIDRNNEQQALLTNRYVYFHFNLNELLLGHAQDEASCLSKFFFYWVEPLITKGVAGNLKRIEDLFDLPDCLNISRISEKLHMQISRTKSTFWALHKTFGREFYLIGILRFIADTSGFAGPLLLGGLLSQAGTDLTGTDSEPYWYALGLFGSTLLSALCSTHFNWRMSIIGMKMRIGVVSAIYRKALEARGLKNSRPEILNLMSTDTDRIVNSCVSFHSFWSIPFQLFTTLYLLYTQLGVAFLAGVAFAAMLIPINRWIARSIGSISKDLMTAKDARLAATSETIAGAKQVKLHAWEDVFIQKIRDLRKEEIKYLGKRKYLDALCVYFWATTPVLMCLLTFGMSAILGNKLTAATTYTSVALLNMLIGPLNAFPWVLNGLVEAWVSVRRLQELFELPNLDFSSYYQPVIKGSAPQKVDEKPTVLQLKDASFEHDQGRNAHEDSYTFRLKKINLDVKRGDLICIEGPLGGGKSTFVSALVAAIDCVEGYVCVHDLTAGFGYVPQTPWLQRGTIRDNILWGAVFDEQLYKNVLFACGLSEDLEALGGDLIGVGENGRTLSGGQRARVSLARAVYQDKKIYLLDDVLSSLDAHVANHVVKYCLLGLLKDKTRIIVTSNKTLFFNSNQILHVDNGVVTKSDFMSESIDLSLEDDVEVEPITQARSRMSSVDLLSDENADRKSLDSVMMEESREYGNLSLNVISCYWRAVACPLGTAVLVFVVLMQLSRNISDAWLAHWVTETNIKPNNDTNSTTDSVIGNETLPEHDFKYYLGIFASLALANSMLTLIRAFLFAYAGIKAAKIIHDKLLNRVLFTKFQFFDITSVGRILNRFSSDTYTIDDSLPFILNILLAQVVGLTGALCISLYAMPWLGLIVIPMIPIYLSLQYRYRYASRDIKRLSSNALSPLYTHFTETLEGITTIRTMRAGPRFQRDFHVKLEESIKAQLTSASAQQWLGLRLQMLGAMLVGGAGILAAMTSAHTTNPGMVGLAISYALSITGLLSGVLNALAETEQEMIAVERVDQYLKLEEEPNAGGSADPPFGWPSQGVLAFKQVQLRYREHLTPALVNLSFQTAAFERIAIVGRTGAGKSSIIAALLRVAPLNAGEISLDCVNLKTLPLKKLRDRIGIIPQEPFLFEGTVRENLDPRSRFIDSEIWNAITNCLATPLVQSLGGLQGKLEKGGTNLSAGQKQLLCLTRALLKNAKVVCIDEGTSNLDSDSEAAIQIALRNSFKSSTIIFIAHRLSGLQNMDRIIVLDHGEIVEQGIPNELAQNTESLFHGMLQAQRNKDYNINEGVIVET
ncbi:ATP-binding cassette sub-family C member 10 [Episyrphus balteatus]|uniref:ATP-binding cassette sub-family C member 10 n=1 Tax=Episyrphus balteatus TaxID=286459 RepID=UPI0024865417|nr:ATP-binding cassette sub-family C member 10 [Episyrphus balteatus]